MERVAQRRVRHDSLGKTARSKSSHGKMHFNFQKASTETPPPKPAPPVPPTQIEKASYYQLILQDGLQTQYHEA